MTAPLKQSNSVFNSSVYVGVFGEDEIGVSEILLDLPKLISDSECQCQISEVQWGKKRRRSALDSTSNTSTSPPSQSPLPCLQAAAETKRYVVEIKKKTNKNVETAVFAAAETATATATSPSTPLSFSPSESDERHKSSSKQSNKSNSKKRTREELLETIDRLNQQRLLLKGEIGTMRSKHFILNATNLELKAKKHELNFGQNTDKMPQPQLGMNVYQMTMFAPPPPPPPPQHHHQFSAYESLISGNFQDIYGQRTPMGTSPLPHHGMRLVNQVGPRGIPDLNVCVVAEDPTPFVLGTSSSSQPLDLMMNRMLMMDNNNNNNECRIRAAEARRLRRKKINEVKNHQGGGRSQSQSQHHHRHGPLNF